MILDIVLVTMFVFMMLYGYKKGCIGIIAKLVSAIIAFVLAYFLADTIGGYISNTNFGTSIINSVESNILNKLNNSKEESVITMLQENKDVLDRKGIIEKITNCVFTGIGFVIVFVASRIVLWIVQKILENVFEIPILKTFNKLGGIISAVILFIIEISVFLAIIKSMSSIYFMNRIVNFIQSSVITKMLYDHNIFINIILSKII